MEGAVAWNCSGVLSGLLIWLAVWGFLHQDFACSVFFFRACFAAYSFEMLFFPALPGEYEPPTVLRCLLFSSFFICSFEMAPSQLKMFHLQFWDGISTQDLQFGDGTFLTQDVSLAVLEWPSCLPFEHCNINFSCHSNMALWSAMIYCSQPQMCCNDQSNVWMGAYFGAGRQWTQASTLALERRGNIAAACPNPGRPSPTQGGLSDLDDIFT